jgi:hypothetical protein
MCRDNAELISVALERDEGIWRADQASTIKWVFEPPMRRAGCRFRSSCRESLRRTASLLALLQLPAVVERGLNTAGAT